METEIVKQLRSQGYRITTTRRAIMDIVENSRKPFLVQDLINKLIERHVSVNKTTVYREIDFLIEQDVLTKLTLIPGQTHYEFKKLDHHHHLICDECHQVFDVECPGFDFQPINRQAKQKQFKIFQPSVEFHGLCQTCQ